MVPPGHYGHVAHGQAVVEIGRIIVSPEVISSPEIEYIKMAEDRNGEGSHTDVRELPSWITSVPGVLTDTQDAIREGFWNQDVHIAANLPP